MFYSIDKLKHKQYSQVRFRKNKRTKMKQYHKREDGVVHIDVILISIIFVAIVGFVAFRVVSNRSGSVDTSNAALQQNSQNVDSALQNVGQKQSGTATQDQSPNLVQP